MLLLTKILSQIAYPLLTSLLLAALAGILLLRQHRRSGASLLAAALGWLWLWSLPVFSDWVCATLEQRYPPTPIEALPVVDAMVLLGGATQPPKPPQRLTTDLSAAGDRIIHAARLFRAGKAPLIIASGGSLPSGKDAPSEAALMAALLEEWGVPKNAIVLEGRSRTTRENRDYTLPILQAAGVRRILLVTSAQHMPRALALFQATGLEVIPAPTDFEVPHAKRPLLRWLPDALALADSSRAFKEYLGYWVDDQADTHPAQPPPPRQAQ